VIDQAIRLLLGFIVRTMSEEEESAGMLVQHAILDLIQPRVAP
jgi:hypothetical protein